MREQARVVGRVLRDPTLARIELAYLGFNVAEYAVWTAILVYAYGRGGAGLAALAALIQLVPAGLVAPIAASLADRYQRDRVLLAGYIWQAAAFGATAVALYADAPFAVTIAVAAVAAASVTITRPVQGVILPAITHAPADLTAANAVTGFAETLGMCLGPLLAGVLLVRSQPGDVLAAVAVIAVVAAALVARLPADFTELAPPGTGPWRAAIAEPIAGLVALRREPTSALLVAILATTTLVIGALDVLFVATAIDLLRLPESWAGYLYSAFGFGGAIGALATVTLVGRRRMTPALATGGNLYGLPISAIAVLPLPITAVALFGSSGVGLSIATVSARTLLQRVAPEALLARVLGVLEGLSMFALAAGSVLAGVLVTAQGVGTTLVVVGLLVPGLIAVLWLALAAIDRHARVIDGEALELLHRLPIFSPLSAPSMERVLSSAIRLEAPAAAVVIREGDIGDRFYVVASGTFEVSVRGDVVSRGGPGEHFGEIALLRDVPRTATITALEAMRLIAIDREPFLEAVTGHAGSQRSAQSVADERMRVAHR